MAWNWQLPDWPNFNYKAESIIQKEKQFLLNVGGAIAFLKSIDEPAYQRFVVEILSDEGVESSRIEGEFLDRESLQSSIRRHFGLQHLRKAERAQESQMANLLCDVFKTFDQPLTHEMICGWHAMLFQEASHIEDRGRYRTHAEPMQIVSHRYDRTTVFFEAPPSDRILKEMTAFVEWFNRSAKEPVLARASIAHLYFESIHPFEDGNGRLGRILVGKILSQAVERPVLIAVSKVLEKRKKEYYASLERCNRTLDVDQWVEFFSEVVLQAQEESMRLLQFLIDKSKMLTRLSGQLNIRQEKALLRLFAEGPAGFKGGLSAENYIAITKASRATATRDLADLVQKGALVKTGELRHTRYWLNISS